MGNCNKTSNKDTNDIYNDFCPYRIATLYADIDETINKKKKISAIVEYFMRAYYGYNIDILCIQGIHGYKILKEIVYEFKKRINQYNDENTMGYNKAIYLEYYPDVDCSKFENKGIYWSTSESDVNIKYRDKLIISRHAILQSVDMQISRKYANRLANIDTLNNSQRREHMHVTTNILNNDSDDIYSDYKYIQIVNINVDGILVSVYNVELESDNIGISNNKERKIQLQEIKKAIDTNRNNLINPSMRKFVHGDSMFVAANRDIHIVTGMFHINEIKNDEINDEYNRMILSLNFLDMNRWIGLLRKENIRVTTNVKFTKDIYSFLVSQDINDIDDISVRSQKIFERHKIVIISSNITKNYIDMNQFTYYPEDTVLLLYRPNITLFSENLDKYIKNRDNKHTLSNTTKFMDQIHKKINYNTNKSMDILAKQVKNVKNSNETIEMTKIASNVDKFNDISDILPTLDTLYNNMTPSINQNIDEIKDVKGTIKPNSTTDPFSDNSDDDINKEIETVMNI